MPAPGRAPPWDAAVNPGLIGCYREKKGRGTPVARMMCFRHNGRRDPSEFLEAWHAAAGWRPVCGVRLGAAALLFGRPAQSLRAAGCRSTGRPSRRGCQFTNVGRRAVKRLVGRPAVPVGDLTTPAGYRPGAAGLRVIDFGPNMALGTCGQLQASGPKVPVATGCVLGIAMDGIRTNGLGQARRVPRLDLGKGTFPGTRVHAGW